MPRPQAKLSRRKKLVFGSCTVAAFFLLLEGAFAVLGIKPLYLTEDPYVGFQPGAPLFVRDGDTMRTNPVKLCYFNPQSFPAKKGPGAYRIFCLGGSTTFGHPYDDRTSFSRWLQARLEDAEPNRTWEVVNCGGISYASYRECLLVQELARYEPDLFVICTGHNEFLEERTYAGMHNWSTAAAALVARTRIGTLLSRLARPRGSQGQKKLLKAEVDTILDNTVGPASYARDEEFRQGVIEHFGYSLDRMAAMARSAGARVIFVKPPANLRDFTPFKSAHGDLAQGDRSAWEEAVVQARKDRAEGRLKAAVEGFLNAAEIDPQYALGLWEAGEALFAAGRYAEARRFFQRAVDEDICPLRATSAIRESIEQAAHRSGAPLVDWPGLLEAAMPGPESARILGDESFLDHVHPTIDGQRILAWALFDQLVQWNVVAPRESTPALIERVSGQVLREIDSRAHAQALVQVIQVLSWAGKNEEALRLTERAEKTCGGLSDVASYRGRILQKLGRGDEAFACFREAVRRNPQDSLALSRLAFLLLERNRLEEARAYFATAIHYTPAAAPLKFQVDCHAGFGETFMRLKQWQDAAIEFRAVLDADPQRVDVRRHLAEVEAHLAKAGDSR